MSNDIHLTFSISSSNSAERSNETYSCSECNKIYWNKSSLRRHQKLCHQSSDEVDNSVQFECYLCGKKHKYKSGLDYHYLHIHKIKNVKIYKKNVTCPLCQHDIKKTNYFTHCETVHEINIDTEEFRFSSFDDFKVWKEQIERNTNSKYSQERGEKADKYGVAKVSFKCHRSGYYKSKGVGIRHLKKQGSCKINGYCPAGFEISKNNKDGKCHVIFTKTHIGHENDIIHLQLSSSERDRIASKLAAQIPLDDILDKNRDAIRDTQAERVHLITKKDLYNIEQCYNLKNTTVHKKSQETIDSWISQTENSCILYYKPTKVVCEHCSYFTKDDFVLIIMNDAQYEILKKHNKDCVCIDNIYCSKYPDFHLVSLLVLDVNKQAFPCAFLISNRNDDYILSFFYDKIKFKCGNITPRVFMSDLQEFSYSSWLSIMEQPPATRLYCSWCVDKAWRANLKMIESSDKQVEVYKLLRRLLEEKDCDTFQNMLKWALEKMFEDRELLKFGKYFKEHFEKTVANWAHCYNLEFGLDLNLHFEGMHRSLEHLFLQEKESVQLDKVIPAIMRFVRDTLAGRFAMLYKCTKLTRKLKVIENRHKLIGSIVAPIVKEKNGWSLKISSVPSEVYLVRENVKNCNCGVICYECNACLHRYVCSCIDNSVRWNMCKHIHYVCSFLSRINKDNNIIQQGNCINTASEANEHITDVSSNSADKINLARANIVKIIVQKDNNKEFSEK